MINQKDKTFLEVEMIYEEEDLRGIAAIFLQVFFRYRMGERYFNLKSFWRGLLFILFIRFLFLGKETFQLHLADIIPTFYVVFSFWHLMQQYRLEAQGEGVHSYFMGYSHFFFLGKLLFGFMGGKSAYYLTYIIIEPAFTLGIAAFIYFYLHALFTALFFVITAFILLWIAFDRVSSARQIYVNRRDGELHSEVIKDDMIKANDEQMRTQGIDVKVPALPIYSSPLAKKVPPIQSSPNHKVVSVSDALKNLNPNLKNLGKEDKA